MPKRTPLGLVLLPVLALAACGGAAPPQPPAPAVDAAAAARDLAAYEQLVAAGSHEFAVTMGREVLRKHPGSEAAAAVAASLPEVERRWREAVELRRLAALWSYQTGTQSGAPQSSASIYSSEPGDEATRVRLIFRRHGAWGESAYVYAGGGGFSCREPCRVTLRYDDAPPVSMAAEIPATGEPAIFLADHEALLARLASTRRLTVEATLKDRGPSSLVFETAGFDAAQYRPLPPR